MVAIRWHRLSIGIQGGVLGAGLLVTLAASATALEPAIASSEYLLIGTGDAGRVGTSTAVSNFELGANSMVVPMSGLAGSVPPLPGNALSVTVGITGDGDVAITDTAGNFNYSNIDVWGNMGVDCASATVGPCIDGLSNSNFNGTPMTPSSGVNANVNLNPVLDELSDAELAINGLASDITLDFSDNGIWDTSLSIVLVPGLTVFDFDTGGNDLNLQNFSNLLIDGPADAFAIFRIPDDANFLVSQSNLVVGDGGIGLNNVLFFTDKQDNNAHISIDDAIVNGVAFWDVGNAGGEIQFDNVQGCTQVVADKINLNDVRLNNCAFVSEPLDHDVRANDSPVAGFSARSSSETNCGIGFEIALLLPAWGWLARRRMLS